MIPIRFAGAREVKGPLTVGQRNIARWLAGAPHHPAALLTQVLQVPAGATAHDVAETFSVLVSRHEALRTRYRLGNPGEQIVSSEGTLTLTIGPADLTPIDLENDVPLRVSLDAATTEVTVVYSHVAVDFQALQVIRAQFDELIRDPSARVVGDPGVQPVDRAELEQQPARRRRMAQALRHWDRNLEVAAVHPYAKPRVSARTGSGACGMWSPAAATALDHIAARTRTSRPTIVMAAFCALLARRTGDDTQRFVMLSANRFESSLAGYVGSLAQSTFVTVGTQAAGFDELVRRCFGAVLQAGLHGAYDVYDQHERSAAIAARRGVAPTFEPLFNSVVLDMRGFDPVPGGPPTADALRPALRETRTAWVELPPTEILLRFDLGRVDEAMVARVCSGDVGRVPPEEAEMLLRALERLLLRAAPGDLDTDGVQEALEVEQIERPDGWLRVDHCWVDVAEVRQLVVDALAPAACRIVEEEDGVPLVAYVAGWPGTAEEAHTRCLAALPGRHAAMAPRRFHLS